MDNINNIDQEYDTYKDWDFSNAKPANTHPLVQKLQERHLQTTTENYDSVKALDDDVFFWVVKQDKETKRHINDVIRHIMAMKENHVVIP